MGLLDLMLGQSSTGKQGVEGRSYTLPKDTHDFVYPVAVRRTELEAFVALLEADADAPSIEDNADELQAAFDEVLGESEVDATKLAETQQKPRRETERLLERWTEQVTEDIGVVYARPGTYPALAAFVRRCAQRDDADDDPFALPEAFGEGTALLKRLEEASNGQYRAVVHTDLLPEQ
ncbi:hypothetical protein [Natronorubrum sulfidifaciens]|uniref:Uncharacterized protein n=1 Tax=Natronorubrum sulfidifaciens JCM 14089 TaxID=1230460 RepID=L9W4Y6_9EURY|nr:hypothetical protein [Natronorubrum sulfidifaciens]ELY44366.1 hypothetical protein C495_10704 [Natronorubrum sulfidifaciens JCM 14089]